MFGSSLNGIGEDIDILVVGPSGHELSILKQELAKAGVELPLDILIMDPNEAAETDFAIKEGCIRLESLAKNYCKPTPPE